MGREANKPSPRPARLPAWSWIIIIPLVSWLALFLGLGLIRAWPPGMLQFGSPGSSAATPSADSPIRVIKAHTGSVTGMAFSPDGTLLASVGQEAAGRLKLWRVADGSLVYSVDAHPGGASSVAFSPDGAMLATGGQDSLVRLWNTADGAPIRDLTGSVQDAISLAFSPDGQTIAAGSWGRSWLNRVDTVHLWRVADGKPLLQLDGNPRVATSVAFSPDGQYLAAGGDDTRDTPGVYIWRLPEGRLVQTVAQTPSWAVQFMPRATASLTQTTLAVAAGPITLINVPDGVVAQTIPVTDGSLGHGLALSPDGRWLITTGPGDHAVSMWRVADTKELHTWTSDDAWVQRLALAPDGTLVAAGALDGSVRWWRVPAPEDK
jgi:WD40 repeat protein